MTMTMEQPSVAFMQKTSQISWPEAMIMTESQPGPEVRIVGSEIPVWLDSVIKRFDGIVALSPEWAGPETVPPTIELACECLDKLQIFMLYTANVPAILPTPSGGIQFEWHSAGWDIEVEFYPDGSGEYWGEDHESSQQISGSISFLEDLTNALKTLSIRQRS